MEGNLENRKNWDIRARRENQSVQRVTKNEVAGLSELEIRRKWLGFEASEGIVGIVTRPAGETT